MRPFRFGVNVFRAGSRAEWADKARKLEALGYSTLTVPDHLAEMLAPMPAALAAAAATTTLRVGTNVLNNDFRHPVLVARDAATIDLLTDGRFQLGLGAGYMKSEYEQTGLHRDPGRVRVARLAESVAIIKALFDGAPVTFAGEHYRVTSHTLHPRPAQRPRPPILIGGNGAQLLTLAAKEADIIGLTGITFRGDGTEPDVTAFAPAHVDERIRLIRAAAGPRYDQVELSALLQRVIVTDDRRRAAEELTQRWQSLTVEDVLASPYALIGTVDQMVEDLRARRERWGLSYHITHELYVDALAPVVARLAGR